MEGRSNSNEHLPEVAYPGLEVTGSHHQYEDYDYYNQVNPAPGYQQYPSTPPISSAKSPPLSAKSPPLGSERATSPSAQNPADIYPTNYKHTPSTPSTSAQYTEYGSPGLQSVFEKEGEKEVYQKSYPVAPLHPHQPHNGPPTQQYEQRKRRICGVPVMLFFILLASIICIAVAVGVGLGVGLHKKHPTSPATTASPTSSPTPSPTPTGDPDFEIGGALNPAYYSKTGAFNGSGIAIASVNFGVDASIFVYFQHWTGELRAFISEADGTWTDSTVVATNARNGTPISAVAYLVDEVATWHIFYIDQDLYVRQRTSSNASAYQTNIWQDGPLNNLNLKANNADMIGLQACYWGNFYGDTDYTYSDGFNATNQNYTLAPTGMHLWYADSDTTFQQYSWYNGRNQWDNDNQTWHNFNGRAGVGCQTWLSGTGM